MNALKELIEIKTRPSMTE